MHVIGPLLLSLHHQLKDNENVKHENALSNMRKHVIYDNHKMN